MLRTKNCETWSAEQHEAAAAALGSFVASAITMPSFAARVPESDRDGLVLCRAMDRASEQVTRWAAVDAASHANAAAREREREAEWLQRNVLVEVCAWCPPDKRERVP